MKKRFLQIIKAKYHSVINFQSNRATQISEWTTSGADRMRYSSIIGNGRQEGQGRIPRPKKRKAQKKQSFFRFKPAKQSSLQSVYLMELMEFLFNTGKNKFFNSVKARNTQIIPILSICQSPF